MKLQDTRNPQLAVKDGNLHISDFRKLIDSSGVGFRSDREAFLFASPTVAYFVGVVFTEQTPNISLSLSWAPQNTVPHIESSTVVFARNLHGMWHLWPLRPPPVSKTARSGKGTLEISVQNVPSPPPPTKRSRVTSYSRSP